MAPTHEQLLLECKQRYPIGTTYKTTDKSSIYTITEDDTFHYGWYGGDNIYIRNASGYSRSSFIYKEGVWATVVEYPEGYSHPGPEINNNFPMY